MTLKRVTVGSSSALLRPWARWKCAPIGRLMPCTSATLEFENAAPASVAPSIIASRAGSSSGCSTTRRMCAPISRAASSASMSVSTVAFVET